MLARHQDWQEKARAEVLEVDIDEENVDSNAISRLKVVSMIINEVLRLFSPLVAATRVAKKDVYIEDLFIPKGIAIELANTEMHTDPEYWGKDAGEFNPLRFANGVSNACTHPQAFNPFSVGPKHCIGNNFALMEMKTVVSIVLCRFRLSMSPNYKHHPTQGLLQSPKFGVPIIFTTL
jgi:cytochrome P450